MRKFLSLLLVVCLLALGVSAALAEQDAEDYGPFASDQAEKPSQKGLEVYFLDEGRVDAILIRCDGVQAFIDVGFKKNAPSTLAALNALGVEKLDMYIGTHAHADHVGGAAALIDALRPDAIYLPHKKVWSAILADADKDQKAACESIGYTVLRHGEVLPIGGAAVKCLGPISIVRCGVGETKENSNSLILRLTYGTHTFLFTGDTSDSVLREVNRKYPGELRADVFKNPHHNGAHGDDIIGMVQPKLTVFCTDNASQPSGSYRRALRRAGSKLYITGSRNDGNVLLTSDGVELQAYRGYALTKLSLSPLSGTMVPGQKAQLSVSMEPKKKGKVKWLNWRSSDPAVAEVSEGTVTAVSEGTATVTATSVNGLSDSVEVQVRAVSLALSESSLSLKVGEAFQLKVKLSSDEAKQLEGEWLTEDDSVAAVTQTGEVLAAGVGETRVIARLSNGAQAVCRVTVSEEPVKSVELDKSRLSLSVGGQAQLSASVSPSDATDKRLEWASSDETVATVDGFGNVTAVGEGEAKIGVRAASGAYDICKVKVK